jgi:hypothetical protein
VAQALAGVFIDRAEPWVSRATAASDSASSSSPSQASVAVNLQRRVSEPPLCAGFTLRGNKELFMRRRRLRGQRLNNLGVKMFLRRRILIA